MSILTGTDRGNVTRLLLLAGGALLAIVAGTTRGGANDTPADAPMKGMHACCAPGAPEHHGEPVDATLEVVEIPDLTFVRMDGARVGLRDELSSGKPVMLNFIFTTCTTICPVMSATFAQVQENLGAERDRVRMVSISIDPEHDTPSRLREYAVRHEAGPEWHFLTATPATVEAAQKAFGAYRGNKFNHAPLTFLRGSHEARWVRVAGLTSAEDLERTLHLIAEDDAHE
jgi:protein SCO1/2